MALGGLEAISESIPFAAKDRPGPGKPARTRAVAPAVLTPSLIALPETVHSAPVAAETATPAPRSARDHYLEQRQRLITVSRSQTMALRHLVHQRRAKA